jgi:hypothetical protein
MTEAVEKMGEAEIVKELADATEGFEVAIFIGKVPQVDHACCAKSLSSKYVKVDRIGNL